MKEMEKNVMCVLLQVLMEKNLITQDVHDQAKEKVLGTLDGADFFCYIEKKREEDADGPDIDICSFSAISAFFMPNATSFATSRSFGAREV